jgi:hypothetical protein
MTNKKNVNKWYSCKKKGKAIPWRPIELWDVEAPTFSLVHSRRQESHHKQMHVISPLLLEWNHAAITWCVPLQGCPKSKCRLTCIRMQWVHCTNCALCPLLAVSCGDVGLALFTQTVLSPRMDCRQSAYELWWDCQPYAPATFYPQEYSWYSFLSEAESIPGP